MGDQHIFLHWLGARATVSVWPFQPPAVRFAIFQQVQRSGKPLKGTFTSSPPLFQCGKNPDLEIMSANLDSPLSSSKDAKEDAQLPF